MAQFGDGWWFRGLLKTFTVLKERQGGDTRVFGGTDGFARRVGGFGADHAFAVGYMRTARASARRRRLRQAADGPRGLLGRRVSLRRDMEVAREWVRRSQTAYGGRGRARLCRARQPRGLRKAACKRQRLARTPKVCLRAPLRARYAEGWWCTRS